VTAKPSGAADPTFDLNGTSTAKAAVATFYRAGTYALLVTVRDAGGLAATSAVNIVVAQTLSGLTVTPANAVVPTGGTQAYAVAGVDQFAQPLAVGGATWSVAGTGVSIDAAGLLTATAATGAFTVTATAGALSASVGGTVADQSAPTLATAASRKTHGGAGTFDLALALGGTPTVEPRIGGADWLVFTFSEAIRPADGVLDATEFSVANAAFASATITGNQLAVRLSSVVNKARTTISFRGLEDVAGNAVVGTSGVIVRSLYGDVNRTGIVNSTDIALVKSASGQAVTLASYLLDVNASGSINSTDISVVKKSSGDFVA
jgi:hypothetical protein